MEIYKNRIDKMIASLKEHECRITPQRMAVLRILAASKDHPTIEQIYARVKSDFPMTSLATIYKNVTLLKEVGEVMELAFGDDKNHYDGNNPHPHPHLMCVRCKSIVDPDIDTLNGISQELAQKTGYQILTHRLDFFGICPHCQGSGELG